MITRQHNIVYVCLASLMILALGGVGGIYLGSSKTLSPVTQSTEDQVKRMQSGVVDLVAVASPELLDSLVKVAGFDKNDLIAERTLCKGVLVSLIQVVVPRRCVLHGDLIGRPFEVQVRGSQGGKGAMVEILAIDQQMDLALIAVESIPGTHPLVLAQESDLSTTTILSLNPTERRGPTSAADDTRSSLAPVQYAGVSDPRTFQVTGISGVHVPGMVLVDPKGRLLGFSSGGRFQADGGPVFTVAGWAIGHWLERLNFKNNRSGTSREEELLATQSPDFKPTRLLSTLGFTVQESSIPYFKRELEGVKVKVVFPIKPNDFDLLLVGQVSDQVEAAFIKLQSENEVRSVPMLTWEKLVFDKSKNFFADQTNLKHRTHFTYDGGKTISPEVVVVTPPLSWTPSQSPSSSSSSIYEPQLISTQSFDLVANQRPRLMGDSGTLAEDQTPHRDSVRSSEPPLQPRLLGRFFSKPLITVRLRSGEQGDQSADVVQRELFEGIAGDSGLMVYGDFRFVKQDRQREVLIQSLEEPLQTTALKDSLGRQWQHLGFDLLGVYSIDTWCGALPGGQLCVTKSFASINRAVHQVFVNFTGKYGLSQYLVEPQFWPIDSLTQFQTAGHLHRDPQMGDFSVETPSSPSLSASSGLKVSYQSRGLHITHPGLHSRAQLRLIGGFQDDQKGGGTKEGPWQALAHEIYDFQDKESRLCQVGLLTKDVVVPKEALIQSVKAKGVDSQVYSYCVPVSITKGFPSLVRTAVAGAKAQPFGVTLTAF